MKFVLIFILILFCLFSSYGQLPTCIKPVIKTTGNQTVSLSAGYATFVCTATGQNGHPVITNYSWIQVSGPTATLVNETTKALTVDFPVVGTFVFVVDATDSCGAYSSALDTLIVTPNAQKDSLAITPKSVHAGTSVVATVYSVKTGNVTFLCNYGNHQTQTHVVNKTSTSPVSATFTTKGWAKKTYTIVAAFANGSTVLGTFTIY